MSGACVANSFSCSDAADCVAAGAQGICAAGHCAFPADDCDSGWKYGAHAPQGVAGTCADGTPGTSSGSGSGPARTSSSGDFDTGSVTTLSTDGTAGTWSSGPPDPTTSETSTQTTTSTSNVSVGGSSSSGITTSQTTEVWGEAADSDHPGTVEDTWINITTENHISSEELRVYTWPSQMISNVILMQWDMSALWGMQVQSATLVLQVIGKEGMTEQPTLDLPLQGIVGVHPSLSDATGLHYAVDAAWTPNMCCYNGIPMAQADLGPVVDLVAVGVNPTQVEWDATALVQSWVDDPDENHGLAISSDEDAVADADRIFASSEYPDTALRPRLIVTYSE